MPRSAAISKRAPASAEIASALRWASPAPSAAIAAKIESGEFVARDSEIFELQIRRRLNRFGDPKKQDLHRERESQEHSGVRAGCESDAGNQTVNQNIDAIIVSSPSGPLTSAHGSRVDGHQARKMSDGGADRCFNPFRFRTSPPRAILSTRNALNTSSVSPLTWCSIPSASMRAVSGLIPSAHRKVSTTWCRSWLLMAKVLPWSVRNAPR